MPTHTVEPPPGRTDRTPVFRRRAVSVLARWPFRRKLNVLVVAPVAVVGALLGVGVTGQIEQVRDADRVAELVRDSEQVAALANDIQAEHRLALLLSVQYDAARPGAAQPSTTAYREAQRATDERVAAVRSAFGSSLPAEEKQALEYIAGLDSLRDKLGRDYVPAANIDPAYAAAVGYLIDGIGLDRFAATSQSSVTNLLDAVLRADAAHAAFESAVFSAQTRDANALTEYTRAVGAHELFTHQSERFGRIARPDQVLRMGGIERAAEQNAITSQFAELQVDPGSLQSQTPRELRERIAAGERQADTRLGITRTLIRQTAAQADALSANALYKAWLMLGLALLGFAAWLAFCVLVRRSVVRPLTALTRSAQRVVAAAGEELARVADDESTDTAPFRPQAIPVPVRDDIGELAEAFNHVQVTAAALLERQMLSRRNVAEMFGNVGRRVSNLTTRQLSLIDAVEREETDPDLLDQLYRIDHIAVRLQRNADSLMLLAGIRETDVEARPTTLADVIRSGLGRIEGYQRVSLRSETDITVGPDIIGDLTLLLAELLENAVSFSPSHTPVEVVVRPGTDVTKDGGALIEVIDHGLGMSAERLAEENVRLVRRERLDLVPTKVLGLFVVGSLARHLGLRVALSRTPGGGVTGTVWIPASLLLTMSPVDDTPAGTTAAPTPRPERTAAAPVPAATATLPERRPTIVSPHSDLPRRVPSRPGPGDAATSEGTAPAATRPLRRRVRGATLTVTTPAADRNGSAPRQPLDADAVRSELDEFEAAVRRAEQDAAATETETTTTTTTADETGTTAGPETPEGQKETGSDDVDR
ncbi:sensor histidine kinase [Streptomyces caniscabiei]|uniref:histidine kinase n=1 Tax=Streptomyces caniscabiei TaxID=2746961 RepID=A0ABU4MVW6_9ACTN|nr:ATP-binding protein [Streptomyces caniscabiei]MBE4733446.1 sensor histidine kinase [Streptomyces caniscabiei]MBE4754624.1 sensor histidine kinase [Streptomyces caniscabiei]MBE4768555.1 sensor histidine kinase [Streptomyces caniscabiei]MBE4781941.1 sensor histidine kinase [Streptomyces caniscabiei]MBE4793231.1 sensor histidine kinase [Streptomyces caniscabiei]